MSQNITDLKAVELRERKNMAGGLSTFERQAALTDPFTNIHERMALEGGTQARSSGPSSGGLSMPPPPSPSLPGVMPNQEAVLGVLAPQEPRPVLSSFQQVSMPSLPTAQSAGGASESFQRSQVSLPLILTLVYRG
jgi:hypothetical protein